MDVGRSPVRGRMRFEKNLREAQGFFAFKMSVQSKGAFPSLSLRSCPQICYLDALYHRFLELCNLFRPHSAPQIEPQNGVSFGNFRLRLFEPWPMLAYALLPSLALFSLAMLHRSSSSLTGCCRGWQPSRFVWPLPSVCCFLAPTLTFFDFCR